VAVAPPGTIQELAVMKSGSRLDEILKHELQPKIRAKLLINLLGATKDEHRRKEIKDELYRLRHAHYSDISNLSMEELKRRCDELYLSTKPDELEYRYRFLNDDGVKIKELHPDFSAKFYYGWISGQYKPTELLEYIKMETDEWKGIIATRYPDADQNAFLTGDEWEKKYERAYYEKIYKALIRPTIIEGHGGSKKGLRKTRKKRNTKKN
jgi:hypothetical protein